MNTLKALRKVQQRRAVRNRAKIFGTKEKPRLSVYRSNKHIYAQLIDDEARKTLASVSMKDIVTKEKKTKTETAQTLGEHIAKKALAVGVKNAVFDKGRYKYHGRVKALTEGARSAGLII